MCTVGPLVTNKTFATEQRVMEHYLSDLRVSKCDDKNTLPDLVNYS